MSNVHRIQWIDSQIRAGLYPNARIIAEHFEISHRQAARDIEYLRDSLGAPLNFSSERNGYYYQGHAFALPALFISKNDRESLSYLANQYRFIGSENAIRLASLFEKIGGNLHPSDPDVSHNLPILPVETERVKLYSVLQKAVEERHQVSMRYLNKRNEVHERRFNPYKIFTRGNIDYVVGFCEMRQAVRVFRIDRIKRLNQLDAYFQIDLGFNEEAYGESTVFRIRTPYTARIRFGGSLPEKLKAKFVRETGQTYQVRFYDSRELISELMNLTSDFQILSPEWLRQRFLNRLQRLIEAHARV